MVVKYGVSGGCLNIKLIGEMDERSASAAREKCDGIIDGNSAVSKIVINLSQVAFMDSTGIGFLIGRYKRAKRLHIPLYVQSPNAAADKVLSLSGIYTLIPKAE